MASLVESIGCSLPVFDSSTRVMSQKWQYRAIAKSGLTSMVRAALPISPRCGPLDRLLAVADEQFELVASRCGAQVVRHEWGLFAPLSGSPLIEYLSPHVPRDHVLVARVDVIQDGHDVTDEQKKLIPRVNRDFFLEHQHLPEIWYDGNRPEQYINGHLPSEQAIQLFMIDIEPRLDKPSRQTNRFMVPGSIQE